MTIFLHSHLGDGTSVVVDTHDNTRFTIPTGVWPEVAALPNEQQRGRLEQIRAKAQELILGDPKPPPQEDTP